MPRSGIRCNAWFEFPFRYRLQNATCGAVVQRAFGSIRWLSWQKNEGKNIKPKAHIFLPPSFCQRLQDTIRPNEPVMISRHNLARFERQRSPTRRSRVRCTGIIGGEIIEFSTNTARLLDRCQLPLYPPRPEKPIRTVRHWYDMVESKCKMHSAHHHEPRSPRLYPTEGILD